MAVQPQKDRYVDPVCHMEVAKSGIVPSLNYNGGTYYFCTESCRQAFIGNPARYLGKKPGRKKGFWKRYLDRLNKSTGGKPPSCCH
jgi:YHS domain-containing protein